MDGKKICSIMERKVNSALKEKHQAFPRGSKMSIDYKEFSTQTSQHIFELTVTGTKSTFYDGVGFAMAIMFDTFEQLGFIRDDTKKAEVLDDGDTCVYTYLISNEAAEKLLNP